MPKQTERRKCKCGATAIAQTYDKGEPLCERHLEEYIRQLLPQPLPEMKVLVDGEWVTPSKEFMDTVAQIDKAISQPLDDKELEKELVGSIDKVLISYETMLACQLTEKLVESRELIKQRGAKVILALLQQKIEGAEKRGIDSGTKAYESTCESLLGEAKREEGERIFKVGDALLNDVYWRGKFSTGEIRQFFKQLKGQALSGKGAGK